MVELHWTEIDGVTTVWAESRRPLTVQLIFRAGLIDETLATGGQIHLVEHLAMSSVRGAPERRNGTVGGVFTSFGMTDYPEQVSAFLLGACRALHSLPADRLESEKRVLAAEAATKSRRVAENLLVWRYGAAGYGLTGLRELGWRGATLEQLHALTAQRFTSENAILWLSGPPPAGLRLELPHGVKHPVPQLATILPETPSWIVDDECGGVAASAIVPRVAGATFFQGFAGRRLYEQLRIQRVVSYGPSMSYDPLDAGVAHVVIHADSEKNRRAELADAFGEVIEGLQDFDDAEVESLRKELLDLWVGPLAPPVEDQVMAELQRAAMDWIFGRDYESMESLAAEARSVTAADVAAFGRSVLGGALFALPGGIQSRPIWGKQAPGSTVQVVEGQQVPSNDAPLDDMRLVHGTHGVTLQQPNGPQRTVRYAELGAALSYEDGCVVLIGADAASVVVEPTLWRDGPRICREICERVPPQLLLDQGARAPGDIPQPSTTRWQRIWERKGSHAKLFAFMGVVALFGGVFVVAPLGAAKSPLLFLLGLATSWILYRRAKLLMDQGARAPGDIPQSSTTRWQRIWVRLAQGADLFATKYAGVLILGALYVVVRLVVGPLDNERLRLLALLPLAIVWILYRRAMRKTGASDGSPGR